MFHPKDRDEEQEQAARPRIVDLKTLTSVLTGDVYTLASACEVFGVPTSRKRQLHPRVTKPLLEHLLKTVTAELELLNREKETFDGHMLGVPPETCFSPASVAKLCFRNMGIEPPQEKFTIPDKINGIAMQALHAGRAECTIRNTPLPITYVDFHAQFPAVSKLVGCSEIMCAERLEFPDFTAQARDIVENATLDKCFDPAFWKQPWFALVEPDGDVLPLRAKFGQDSDPILGWNYVSSNQPFWVTGLDVIASKILTGKPVKILKAILVQPRGIQAGLVPIKLYNQLQVDPLHDDLSVKLVQLRSQIKPREPHVAGGLKVAALRLKHWHSLAIFERCAPSTALWFHSPTNSRMCCGRAVSSCRIGRNSMTCMADHSSTSSVAARSTSIIGSRPSR